MKKTPSLVVLAFALCAAVANAQSTGSQGLLQKGKEAFQQAQYQTALEDFRSIILNPQYSSAHGDAYYWIALSYIALNRLSDAEKNLEYFLLNFKDNSNLPDAYYQKGRLLYLQNEYQNAIQVLYTFIKSYGNNPFVPNAYYWIGESLYRLGHFDESKRVFDVVVAQFPTSYKFEAAQYRLSVIDLKQRELELMKLLRWSQEEALNAQADFNRREQAYQQAIIAYQRQIAQLQSGSAAEGSSTGASQGGELSALQNEIAQLREQVRLLTAPGGPSASADSSAKLLSLQSEALNLKEFYLNWLAAHPGGGK